MPKYKHIEIRPKILVIVSEFPGGRTVETKMNRAEAAIFKTDFDAAMDTGWDNAEIASLQAKVADLTQQLADAQAELDALTGA